jgi:hypothetical protein
MNETLNETLLPPAPKRGIPEGVVILIGVLAFCVFAVAFLAIDPFRWNVVGNLKMLVGLGGDPVIASIPANSKMYIGIDLLNAQPEKLNRLFKPFADAAGSTTKDTNAAIQDLDKQLKEASGITFTDDIVPWIGKSAGLSIQELQMDANGMPQKVEMVFSVQSRDNDKADAFLKKLKSSIETESDEKLSEAAYANVTIYSLKTEASSGFNAGIAFARSGDVVLVSLTDTSIKSAIDAQKGNSLGKDKVYLALTEKLPKDRLMTMYIAPQQFMEMYFSLLTANPTYGAAFSEQTLQLMREQFQKVDGEIISWSIVEAGLQMDILASYVPEKLTAADKSAFTQLKTPLKTVEMLPENTLLFAGGQITSEAWKTMRDQIIKMGGVSQSEYDESMSQFEKQFKVNPDKDLIPYLGGEMMLAVMPSSQGLFQQAKVNLGAVIALGSTDSTKVTAAVDKFAAAMPALMGQPLDRKEATGVTYYKMVDPSSKTEMFAMGVGKPYLLVGTSGDVLENLFSAKSSLARSARYQSALKTLPNGAVPSFYIDLEGLLGTIRETMPKTSLESFNKSTQALKPVTLLVAGNSMVNDNLMKITMVVFITPVK